jgi:hypothetical protein
LLARFFRSAVADFAPFGAFYAAILKAGLTICRDNS